MGVERIILFITFPAAIAALGAVIICLFGEKAGLMDLPGERSSHSKPTLRGGGVGIWVATVFAVVIIGKAPIFALLIFFIGALGLGEDILSMSPRKRLLVQFVIVSSVIFVFAGIKNLTFQTLGLGIFWLLLIVWTINLYNFMDGIDGIAAITAIVGFSFLAYSAFNITVDQNIGILCVAVAGASFGFLFFNFPKAKVFMGDVGSVTIGFIFIVIVMMLSRSFLDFICLVSFLFTFYADELVTMVVRLKCRENPLKAHRKHFYQMLVNEKGIEHWKVSLGYGIVQLLVGISVLVLRRFGVIIVLPVLLTYFAVFVLVNWRVRRNVASNRY